MRRSAFTLIELIVVMGIIGVLVGMLLPAIQKVKGAAFRLRDQSSAKQLGLAIHNFAEARYGTLPPAKTRENGNDRWWFAKTTLAGDIVDFRGGHLMPYLENNYKMFQGPAKSPGRVYLTFDGGTGGFGYNWRTLAPFVEMPDGTVAWTPVLLSQIGSASRTVAFCNAVGVSTAPPAPSPAEPILVEVALAEPPSAQTPSVHFRQFGKISNILFLDGHVEGCFDKTRNPPAAGDSLPVQALRDRFNVYDLGATDELWDRE